ncbi:putative inactive purple acid phosphatase 27 [Triticum urartu]|uniref:Purple acid phosphatase n=1 Tax=Triticum urartu TaxID=4572 RepID=M8AUC5_TRIUA|nr:putative inactive purple acid phosphatase 27 [Triticum urartu]
MVSASPAEGSEPLSKIAIHKATVDLHGSAYVRATPALLGDQYQYANYSANYRYWGKGTIRFQIINQRSDFSFALFTGGFENPKLVAVSKPVAFKNPKAPVFPRLAQGKTHDEMTTMSRNKRSSRVWFMVCFHFHPGEPARTVGWRDPGFIHTAFMRDLWPNKEYTYKIGHELSDGTMVWGKPYTFRAPPTPGQNSLQRIIVFGDMGKAERDGSNEFANYQPGSLNTTDTLVKDLDNYDIVFHIGDMPYANGYLSQWDQFTAQVAPISARKPYMVASGNHERDWPNTGGFFDVKDSGGECGVPAETMYYYPAENRANFWYKVDYGMFRFCVADTGHDWREGTPQHKFIEECLSTVDRKHQPWLIFAAHRVLGYSSNACYTTAIPRWSVFRDQDYGFVKLTAFNHSSLLFEYKKSSDGNVYDSFTVDRDYRNVLSCVHDSCFPTTLAL